MVMVIESQHNFESAGDSDGASDDYGVRYSFFQLSQGEMIGLGTSSASSLRKSRTGALEACAVLPFSSTFESLTMHNDRVLTEAAASP